MIEANFKPVKSVYDYRIQEWNNDLSSTQQQWDEDKVLLSTYKEDKVKIEQIGFDIKEQIKTVVEEIENTVSSLESELLNAGLGLVNTFKSQATLTPEEIFNMLFEPFMQALEPLMSIIGTVGLPEIPVIGNIQNIIQQIAKTGSIISKLPKQVREAARAEAKLKKQKEELEKKKKETSDQLAEAQNAQKEGSSWDRPSEFAKSRLGKIVNDIVSIFWDVLKIITMICECAVIAAIMMLIEKIKPIVGALGNIVAIITSAQTVMKMLILSASQMVRYFYKMLVDKLSELWDIISFVVDGGFSLPVNALISGVHADMICCEFEMSSINMKIDDIKKSHKVDLKKENIKKYKENKEKYENLLEDINKGDYDSLADYRSEMIGTVASSLLGGFGASTIKNFAKKQIPVTKPTAAEINFFNNAVSSIENTIIKETNSLSALSTDLETHRKEINSFNKLAPQKYEEELKRRTNEDEYLKKFNVNEEELKKEIAKLSSDIETNESQITKTVNEIKEAEEAKKKEAEEAAKKK